MPPTPPSTEMGRRHEIALAEAFDGRKTKASGSQWFDQGDVVNPNDMPFAFIVDGKSTKAKQLAVTLDIIRKLREQSQGQLLAIGMRWYGNDALTDILEDWVAIELAAWVEILPAARAFVELQAALGGNLTPQAVEAALRKADEREALIAKQWEKIAERDDEISRLRQELAAPGSSQTVDEMLRTKDAEIAELRSSQDPEGLHSLRDLLKARDGEIAELRRQLTSQDRPFVPENIPMLPWTTIYQWHLPGRTTLSGQAFDAAGHITQVKVEEAHVERTHDSANRPMLVVNGYRIRNGDLYVDGKLNTRACESDQTIEVG